MDLNLNITLMAADARSYYDSYEVLKEKKLTSPSLVCLAFSTELHVKLLLLTYDITATGHDISKLIKKLPKDEITRISTDPDFHYSQQGENFFKNITIASDLFVRTRYYFEKLGTLHFNSGFCATLCEVIRKRIVNRVPYLKYDLGAYSE